MGGPDWPGLLKWSLQFQDGTGPARPPARELSEEDKAFFYAAMEEMTVDEEAEVEKILAVLAHGPGSAALPPGLGEERLVELQEELLEDLIDLVSQVDRAWNLYRKGGLPVLLRLLVREAPSLRGLGAGVLATCAQNQPKVQEAFHAEDVMAPLLRLLRDPHLQCRSKALFALGSLMRNYHPALVRFVERGGLVGLLLPLVPLDSPVSPELDTLRSKTLRLMQYVVSQEPAEGAAGLAEGLGQVVTTATQSDDPNVREAAMMLLAQLARDGPAAERLAGSPGLQAALGQLRARHAGLSAEDADAIQLEKDLLRETLALLPNTV